MARRERYILRSVDINDTPVSTPLNVQVTNLINPGAELSDTGSENFRQKFHIRNFSMYLHMTQNQGSAPYDGYRSWSQDFWIAICDPTVANEMELNGMSPTNQYWLQNNFILKKWWRTYLSVGGETTPTSNAYAFNPRELFRGKVRLKSVTLREQQSLYLFTQQRTLQGGVATMQYDWGCTMLYRWKEITQS